MKGSFSLCTMRLPVKLTSASISRQRSVWKASTGSTLSAGCCTEAPRCFFSVLESAPISGARSAKRSWLETRLPDSFGRGTRATKVRSPRMSLSPIRPLKSW
ncbi:hypothetical protein D9M69_713700 [compost metagenome]